MTEQIRLGNLPAKKEDYDKLHVVVITLGPNGTESTDELVKFLSLILSTEVPLEARKRELQEQYSIEMTHAIEEEMSGVCNLGEAIARRNLEAGIAQGLAEGIEKGEAIGAIKTLASLVRNHVITIQEAAKQANMSEVDFCKKAGLTIPQQQ